MLACWSSSSGAPLGFRNRYERRLAVWQVRPGFTPQGKTYQYRSASSCRNSSVLRTLGCRSVTTERIKALNASIREVLEPPMAERGFRYAAKSRTFRKAAGECTQIVGIQVGLRSLEGQFTVNLAVFHPEYRPGADGSVAPVAPEEGDCWARARLGTLRRTLGSRLLGSRFDEGSNFLLWRLTTAADRWWRFTADKAENDLQLRAAMDLLFSCGMDWFGENSDVSGLRAKHEAKRRSPAVV